MRIKKIIGIALTTIMLLNTTVFASPSSYSNKSIQGVNVKAVTIDISNPNVTSLVLNANGQMASALPLSTMAKETGAFAAINGTYFEAYNGTPIPWGTIIKDGKVIHISNGGSVAGITNDGKLIIDRLSFEFKGYINGVYRAIPWRINHPSTEPDAITIFTHEYGTTIELQQGAKAVIVKNDVVSRITDSSFILSNEEFAIVYNSNVTYLVDERYKVGDKVTYEVIIKTTFTKSEDWGKVVNGLGAGPSLIINGNITADGLAEGFFEDKINKNAAGRSFIGATADDKIVIGNMGAVTIKQAAEIAKEMNLVNAMCLDGGGSIALYYPEANVSIAGRNINNGLAFVEIVGQVAIPTSSQVIVDGKTVGFEAYNINGYNYFKLRDIAMALTKSKNKFNVTWDGEKNAINLITDKPYDIVGGELVLSDSNRNKSASPTNSSIYLNNEKVELTAYNIKDNNYFKLRDLGVAIGFEVDWDAENNSVIIKTK